MPNHFHLEVFVKSKIQADKLNKGIAILLRSYTRAIQKQEGLKGSLFQQKTKAKDLSSEDMHLTRNRLSICAHYIHQNPAKAGLVSRLSDWQYSSFNQYLNAGEFTCCNIEFALDYMGVYREEFTKESYQLLSDYYLDNELT